MSHTQNEFHFLINFFVFEFQSFRKTKNEDAMDHLTIKNIKKDDRRWWISSSQAMILIDPEGE